MEPNTIYYQEQIIAHHCYKDDEWKVKLNKELTEENKEIFKEIIKKMARRNKIDVEFEDDN